MGSCASVHKSPDSVMNVRLSFGSKADKCVVPSPVKEKPADAERPVAGVDLKRQISAQSPAAFRDFGSKEETFFDSRPWLDSDCEDDFFSINGDFTPSRGCTPVHQSLIPTPQADKAPFADRAPPPSKPEPSPKKKLSELFRDEEDEERRNNLRNQTTAVTKMDGESVNTSPFTGGGSLCSSERSRSKLTKSAQCCLPRMLSSRSLDERKGTSPACS